MNEVSRTVMDVRVFASKDVLGAAAAEYVVERINYAILMRGQARVIFATGASQYEFLAALVRQKDTVDWNHVTAFHLDEYIGLPDTHPASFRRYLRERLFSLLPFRTVHLLDGTAANIREETERYATLLASGPIDLACVGIGENAHLAFNDPPADFDTVKLVHVVTLDEACRLQQVGEGHFASFEAVPTQALSLSVPAILRADVISCVVPDARKAAAVQCALEGPIVPECPASALQKHKHTTGFLDNESAAGLTGSKAV
jgi:glucosamine-6-phosphate deaminase